jgi:hypothetical protein
LSSAREEETRNKAEYGAEEKWNPELLREDKRLDRAWLLRGMAGGRSRRLGADCISFGVEGAKRRMDPQDIESVSSDA